MSLQDPGNNVNINYIQNGICVVDFRHIIQQIINNFHTKLKISIISFVAANLIHTYLLGYVNNGFRDDGHYIAKYINTGNNYYQVLLLWSCGGLLSSYYIRKIKEVGLFNTIFRVINFLKSINSYISNPSPVIYKAIAGGIGLGYFIHLYSLKATQLLIGIVGITSFGGIIPPVLAGLVRKIMIANANNLPKEVVYTTANITQIINIVLVSSSITLFCFSDIPFINKGALVLVAYLVYNNFIKNNSQGNNVNKVLRVFLYIFFGFLTYKLFNELGNCIYADDGGWEETVNRNAPLNEQLVQWIKSEASIRVMKAGIPPSVSSGIGAAVADGLQEIKYYVLQVSSDYIYLKPNQVEELMVAVWQTDGKSTPVIASDAVISVSSATSQPWLQIYNNYGNGMITCKLALNPILPNNCNVADTESLIIVANTSDSSYSTKVIVKAELLPSNYVLELF